MGEEDCGFLGINCTIGDWVDSAVGDAIENMANAVLEAFGKAVASLGTLWVNIGTPNLALAVLLLSPPASPRQAQKAS